MNLLRNFESLVYINSGPNQGGREYTKALFGSIGVPVRRFPAVDPGSATEARGYGSMDQYAKALSMRLVIRQELKKRSNAVLIISDAITYVDDFVERLSRLDLPDDWGLFYFGCAHLERPDFVSDGIVRVKSAVGMQGIALRSSYYHEVMKVLRPDVTANPTNKWTVDDRINALCSVVPTYAAFPDVFKAFSFQDPRFPFASRNVSKPTKNSLVLAGLPAINLGGSAFQDRIQISMPNLSKSHLGECGESAVSDKTFNSIPLGKEKGICLVFPYGRVPENAGLWDQYAACASGRIRFCESAISGDSMSYANRLIDCVLRASEKDDCGFFIFLPREAVPIRPANELMDLLGIDGRNRFIWNPLVGEKSEVISNPHGAIDSRIPMDCICFHSRWVGLNKATIELVAENSEVLSFLASIKSWPLNYPAECPFRDWQLATLLNMAGFPLNEGTACQSLTWPVNSDSQSPDAGLALGSGCYFSQFPVAALKLFSQNYG